MAQLRAGWQRLGSRLYAGGPAHLLACLHCLPILALALQMHFSASRVYCTFGSLGSSETITDA